MKTLLLFVVILLMISCNKDILTDENPKTVSNDNLNIRIAWISSMTDSLLMKCNDYYAHKVPSLGRASYQLISSNSDLTFSLTKFKYTDCKIKVSIYIHHGNPARLEGDSLVYQIQDVSNPLLIKGKFSDARFKIEN